MSSEKILFKSTWMVFLYIFCAQIFDFQHLHQKVFQKIIAEKDCNCLILYSLSDLQACRLEQSLLPRVVLVIY